MKHTFYMLVLANKAYIPSITSFCGNIIETEQVRNQVKLEDSKGFFMRALSPPKINGAYNGFLNWDHKCKISIGIMEFFLDIVSFNPNDEFGSSSLYLCSPIEASFGYNFYYEAKLLNYDQLFTASELEQNLNSRYCKSDLDCVYTKQCSTKCDLATNKCSFVLVKPQIIDFCQFLKEYIGEYENVSRILDPFIEKCLKLNNLYILNERNLFDKNEMPINFQRHKSFIETSNYWKNSLEFTTITNELNSALWNLIKFMKDPVKKRDKKKN